MKKFFYKLNIVSLLLAVVMLVCIFAPLAVFADEEVATSGKCGDKLTWKYSAGTLTIEGEGDMTEFREPDMAPWYPLRDKIIKIVLPEKLTTIGALAFYDCNRLRTVVIPDYVTRIGRYAFAECSGLESVKFGIRVSEIKKAAFYNCKALQSVRFPYSIKLLDTQAFYNCTSLRTITIPSNLTELGYSVFAYCSNLIKAEINAALKIIPEWTFYGCEKLSFVVLPETIKSIEGYAFKNCTDLINVYFTGNSESKNNIEESIKSDIPEFEHYGEVSDQIPPESVISSIYTEDESGVVVQTNTTVSENDAMTVVTSAEHTYKKDSDKKGTYDIDITISLENKDSWDDSVAAVESALKKVNDTMSALANAGDTTVNLYIKEGTLDIDFLESMSHRDLTINVVTSEGSAWKIDCNEVDTNNVPENNNYSYTLDEASEKSCEKLGTDDCYQLSFDESAKVNAEVIIKLPEVEKNSNAFLYQVENDGSHTRLQAVAVDNDGNAHFYLGSVDEKTDYVIGLNVPGEKTDDVIIPDELSELYGAIERLEKIEYVLTGVESSWGMGFGKVTWILVGVLVFCFIAVGVFMGVMNKRKQKKYAYGGNK